MKCNIVAQSTLLFVKDSNFLVSATHTSIVDITDYCQLVGKLIYLTIAGPYISFLVGLVSRFMTYHQQTHLEAAIKAAMHIVKYI